MKDEILGAKEHLCGIDPYLGQVTARQDQQPRASEHLSGFDKEWPHAFEALSLDEYISAKREYDYNRSPEKADLDRLRAAMESKIDSLQSEQRDLLREHEKLHERLDRLATAKAVESLEKEVFSLAFDQSRIVDACRVIVGYCAEIVSVSRLVIVAAIGTTLVVWASRYWKAH